jgi:REP element-mobilizing transposase RayT
MNIGALKIQCHQLTTILPEFGVRSMREAHTLNSELRSTYFVATTGQVSTEVVKRYIENQRGR